jgi:hypothetical protein
MSCWIVNRIAELKTQGRITDEHVKFLMNKIELLEEEGRILLEDFIARRHCTLWLTKRRQLRASVRQFV